MSKNRIITDKLANLGIQCYKEIIKEPNKTIISTYYINWKMIEPNLKHLVGCAKTALFKRSFSTLNGYTIFEIMDIWECRTSWSIPEEYGYYRYYHTYKNSIDFSYNLYTAVFMGNKPYIDKKGNALTSSDLDTIIKMLDKICIVQ